MIIHETRWKCDYCGAVSPVTEEEYIAPPGWLIHHYSFYTKHHFCCQSHLDKWLKSGVKTDDIVRSEDA
jgi:hypothetical protein